MVQLIVNKDLKRLEDKKFVEITLVDAGIPIENLIRYDSGWIFGWKEPMQQSEVNEIQKKINKLIEVWKDNSLLDDWQKLVYFNQSVQYKVNSNK